MKKHLVMGALAALMIGLAGCGKLSFSSDATSTDSAGTSTSKYQTTGTVDTSMYQGVIKNGRYQTSSARGLTISTNTQGGNTYNIKSMESGLQALSTDRFPTNKYSFQEGQLLTTATARKWLARKSGDNLDGLNPSQFKDGKKGAVIDDYQTKAPEYLATILEQDYMVTSGNSMKLGGISIALGMNEYYAYQKETYGATYTTHIDQATLAKAGRQMAQEVVARLRKMNSVGPDIPIVVALYKNAEADALVGGTYFATTVSKQGNKLQKWESLDQKNQVLPVVEDQKPINTTVANDFSNFSDQVENFFPTLAGITAQTHYESGQLTGMSININTQFYGETEIESFTQYVATSATKFLPSGTKIEIQIQSTAGMQAFLARESGDKTFYTHVFGSY